MTNLTGGSHFESDFEGVQGLFSSHSLGMVDNDEEKTAHYSPSRGRMAESLRDPFLIRSHRLCVGSACSFLHFSSSLSSSSLELGSHEEEELGVEVHSLWLTVTHESQGLS